MCNLLHNLFLLLNLFFSELQISVSKCHIGIYGRSFQRLILTDMERRLIDEVNAPYRQLRFCRFNIIDGIQKRIPEQSD